LKNFFRTFFALFAAVSITVSAADLKFDKNSLSSVRASAEQGDPEAQYYLGLFYETGKDVEKDMVEAVKWYRKAAEQNDLDAQYRLGLCYDKGEGVPQNGKEAVKWYTKAAENGIIEAQINLGVCYETGKGIENNVPEAVKWYRMAADRKNPEAQYKLGYCYETCGEIRSDDKAAIWYRRAAEGGNAEAQYKIGLFYETGKGVEKDVKEAVHWYAKAAGQGNPDAAVKLGQYYESGADGVPKDTAVAVKWYRKAAELGSAEAQAKVERYEEEQRQKERSAQEMAEQKARDEAERKARDEARAASSQREMESLLAQRKREREEEAARRAQEVEQNEAARRRENLRVQRAREREEKEAARRAQEEEKWRKVAADLKNNISVRMSHEKMTIIFSGELELTLIKVEAGTFEMSRKEGKSTIVSGTSYEIPHTAKLMRDFYIGQTEVTQAQWMAVMGTNPSDTSIDWPWDKRPVNRVTWNDAMAFCEKLNSTEKMPGWKFTLPTETQWEYAARGGKKSKNYKYSGSDEIGEVAWFQGTIDTAMIVGEKKANELGLYDMSGNVWEWCLDDWNNDSRKQKEEFYRGNDRGGKNRVRRGGSYSNLAGGCRSTYRGDSVSPDYRAENLGFRLAIVPY
jgi:TPR repeat protein